MKYFVIGKDGTRYGPVEPPTLNEWRSDGRLNDETMLEEEGTGHQYQAKQVIGISQPTSPPPPASPQPQPQPQSNPQPEGSPYPRQEHYQPPPKDDGKTLLIIGWIISISSLCCCPLIGIVAIILGVAAHKRGNAGGKALIIVSSIVLAIGIASMIYNYNNPATRQMIEELMGQ